MAQAVSDKGSPGSRLIAPSDPTLLQAFAEYFTQTQLTNLVLTAMEELTGSRAKVSLAAAQLMSGVMKKRGSDLIKVVWCWVGSSAWNVSSPGSCPDCYQPAKGP